MNVLELFEFTVESYNTDPNGRLQQSETQTVMAATPQAAALRVLNEKLFPIGNITRLRARVSRFHDNGERLEVTLYSKL